MDNDDWTSAAHNRAIGWIEAELMREVQMRWREREDSRWVRPRYSLQEHKRSRDEHPELA